MSWIKSDEQNKYAFYHLWGVRLQTDKHSNEYILINSDKCSKGKVWDVLRSITGRLNLDWEVKECVVVRNLLITSNRNLCQRDCKGMKV